MKKKILLILLMTVMFGFSIKVDAACYDKELTEWAVNSSVKFINFDKYLIDEESGKEIVELGYDYAYILTLSNMRDDVVLKATTKSGRKLESFYIPGHKVYGLPDYNPKYGAEYRIVVYGGEKSACPNEILKTLDYKVEHFNFYHMTEDCEKYSEADICKMYKDTSDMTYKEFKKEIEEYKDRLGNENDNLFTKIMKFFASYGIFIFVPIIFLVLMYSIKLGKTKVNERKKK